MLRLERAEQGLLSTKNLDGGTGRLGEVHERSGVRNKARANKLADESSQVRSKSLHATREVVAEVLTVLSQVDNLLSESRGGFQVLFCDFGTHGDFCSRLDSSLNSKSAIGLS